MIDQSPHQVNVPTHLQAVLCFRQPLSPTRPLPPGAVGDDGAVSETSPGVELELHHDDDDIWATR